MKKLLYILLLIPSLAFSGIINIKGNVKDYDGSIPKLEFLNIDLVQEFITDNKILITEGRIDKHGNFSVQFNLDKTSLVIIDLGKIERSLFCVPGKSYYINIKGPFNALKNNHGFLSKDVQKAEITNGSPTELNYAIDSLENLCSEFLFNNWEGRKNYTITKNFTDSLKIKFNYLTDSYFSKYLKYKEAELMFYFHTHFKKKFAKEYFNSSNGLDENLKSFQVFQSFFQGIFKNQLLIYKEFEVINLIVKGDDRALVKMVYENKDNYNEQLNELIFLLGINEVKLNEELRNKDLNRLIDNFITNTKFSNHKIIAKNIKNRLNHLKSGSEAPKLFVFNKTRNFDIQDDHKKYIYLCFFKSWDDNIVNEMKIMNYLQKRFEDDLRVICISTDIDTTLFSKLKTKFAANELEIELYHYGYDADILMNYNISDFRIDRYDEQVTQIYYLLNPSGNFIIAPAKLPSKGFEYDFKKVIAP